jgi:hypothetical protein
VCASQEVGHGARMGVEETLFRLGHTVTTPVYLHELREFALWAYKNERLERLMIIGERTLGSMTRVNAYWILSSDQCVQTKTVDFRAAYRPSENSSSSSSNPPLPVL